MSTLEQNSPAWHRVLGRPVEASATDYRDDAPAFVFYPTVPPISLELTSRCNLKCPYCANGTLTRPEGFIAWSLLEKLVDQCKDGRHAIDWLHGTGEPLLWKRVEDVIRLITSQDAGKASFGTNGTLLHPHRIESLLAAGLTSVYVSLDSLNREIYRRRGAESSRRSSATSKT
jgi:cyclic pyranopterin phosphate synthase